MWSQNHSKTFHDSISLHTDAICTEHGLMRHSGEEQQVIVEDSQKFSNLNCVFCMYAKPSVSISMTFMMLFLVLHMKDMQIVM